MSMFCYQCEQSAKGTGCTTVSVCGKDPDVAAKTAEYVAEFATPYKAAERGYIDMVIEPKESRPRIITALNMLASKREARPAKKHGNVPL